MIELRPTSEEDVDTLTELGRRTFVQAFGDTNTKEDIDQYVESTFYREQQLLEIRDSKRRIEIAWAGTVAAGFLHLIQSTPDPCVTGTKPIELLRLYVDAHWHGQGVAQLLMERVLEIAGKKGFQTLWLGVWERNFRAQAFYNKYGFTKAGSHLFKLGNDLQTDLILVRPL